MLSQDETFTFKLYVSQQIKLDYMLKQIGGSLDNFCVDTVTDPISLNPGQSVIIYFKISNIRSSRWILAYLLQLAYL